MTWTSPEETADRPVPAEVDAVVVDAVVVGAGFAGLYLLHRLRQTGRSVIAFDAADDVGGTWYWNRYPGARCDVPTTDYCFTFDPELEEEWTWSEKYATQPEILSYLQYVARKYDLRKDIRFSTRVASARWDQQARRWRVETERGERVSCRFYIMASGCLSVPKELDIEGADRFRGDVYFTSRWPHGGVDFSGKRVAVVGTGSSGIQSIPLIAAQAAQLTVFQRTPNFTFPAHNGPPRAETLAALESDRAGYRESARHTRAGVPLEDLDTPLLGETATPEQRRERFDWAWDRGELFATVAIFADQALNPKSNDIAAELYRERVRQIVEDPETAESLCPRDHYMGTKRPCLDTDYLETYNLPHVRLIDLRQHPISTVTETGIDTVDESLDFDAIVYATGFDAMTGALVSVDIAGRDGLTLEQKWAEGPTTYLGLTTTGFPNLFTITGPGSPSVLCNMALAIEQHVDWVVDCIDYMEASGFETIEPTDTAESGWTQHVSDCAEITLLPTAKSWYMGANVPGKPRMFYVYIGGFDAYRTACDEVVSSGYLGFQLDGPAGASRNDGIIRQMQPDVAMILNAMEKLGMPPMESMSPEPVRTLMKTSTAVRPPGPQVGGVVDGVLPGPGGKIPYRLYRPEGEEPHPAIAYFHGGGWVLGDLDSDEHPARRHCVRHEVDRWQWSEGGGATWPKPSQERAFRGCPLPVPGSGTVRVEAVANLQLRRPPFQFDENTPFQWNQANPLQGLAMNSVTFIAPAFERYIVATVRKAMPQITDSAVREEADLFLRQEAVHARAHRSHAAALVGQYPGLAEVVTAMDSSFDELLESRPLRYHLAYVADIEATFTPIFDLLLRHRDVLFDNGDHRVAPLFLWHFVEEIEHRCSALNIYNAVVPSPWYRLRAAPSVFLHMRHLQKLALRGYQAHVPIADWGFDPADLDGGSRVVRALKGQRKPDPLSAVPRRDKLSALYRFARSQWPGHSPATEQTPPFADEWLRVYEEGRDVVHWYAAEGAGA